MPSLIWRFIRSSAKFIFLVAYRSLSAAVLLLFHWGNFYLSKLQAKLAEPWRSWMDAVMNFIDDWALWLAGAINLGAILHTFFEVDRQIRDPKITRKLKEFYRALQLLRQREVTSEAEVEQLAADLTECETRGYNWIKENMQPITLTRLNQESDSLWDRFTAERKDAFNKRHSELLNSIVSKQHRLLVLIEQPVWL
jgi:hypothetical protein